MSLNKNLSKLALNVNANGDVTEAGLSATYTSNAYAGGTFATNTFVRDTFTSNNYVESQLGTKDTAIGLRATNTFVKDTFTSNNYSQDFFTNADNITSGTIASGRLSGTYSINISGSADSLDGKDSTDFTSNTYINSRNLTSNNFIQDNYLANGNLIEVNTSTGEAKLKYNTTNVLVTGNDPATGNYVNIIGDLEVDDFIQAGSNTGGPALTYNDGGGNSNLTFNHRSQKPDQDGNYGRIVVNTDSSSDSKMIVSLGSGGTANVTGAVTTAATFSDTDQELYYAGNKKLATTSTGVDITGAITVGGNDLVSNNFFQDNSGSSFGVVSATVVNGSASGTYTVPAGINYIAGVVTGGGGGGGANVDNASAPGGGDGGGGGICGFGFAVTPGATYNYSIGAGGNRALYGNSFNNAGSGGVSNFSGNTFRANGGSAGGNSGSNNQTNVGAFGGSGSGGAINVSGATGTALHGGRIHNGIVHGVLGALGGSTVDKNGTVLSNASDIGNATVGQGGGGSGGGFNEDGGAGQAGSLIVYEFS